MYMEVCVWICAMVNVEFKRQLLGVSYCFLLCGLGIDGKCLYLQSHLISPKLTTMLDKLI